MQVNWKKLILPNIPYFFIGLFATNEQLSQLRKGTIVTVVYYCIYEQEYHQLTGAVAKVDPYWGLLQVGHMSIDFSEIDRIEHLQEPV